MKAEITIPTNLNEISVLQYQQYLNYTKDLEGDFLSQKIVSLFCGMSLSDALLIKLTDVRDIEESIVKLLEGEAEYSYTFKIQKHEFGMIPNLEDMSFGEYIDLESNIGEWSTMHKAMAVLFRPITLKVKGKYEITPYKGTDEFSELMKFMPLGYAMGALVFFYRLSKELSKATQNYLGAEMMGETTAFLSNLAKGGDGMEAFTKLHKEILDDLIVGQVRTL